MNGQSPLPPEEKDTVIDVSLKHILIAFGGLVSATFTVGVSIVLLRDYAKYKRQKAIIDAATQLLLNIQHPERSENWKEKKKPTATQFTSQKKS